MKIFCVFIYLKTIQFIYGALERKKAHLPERGKAVKKLLAAMRKNGTNEEECIIVGSGMTASQLMEVPDFAKKTYLTCNFGALLPLPFDLCTVELASHLPGLRPISDLQAKAVKNRRKCIANLAIKNIYEEKVDVDIASDCYQNVVLVPSFPVRFFRVLIALGMQDAFFENFFSERFDSLIQVKSSILTLIQIAVNAGFKRIVVYGLDGHGPHFFHRMTVLDCPDLCRAIRFQIEESGSYKRHAVGYDARQIANEMKAFLGKRGIELVVV